MRRVRLLVAEDPDETGRARRLFATSRIFPWRPVTGGGPRG